MVRAVAGLGRPVVLIPHVEVRRAASDDFRLLAAVQRRLRAEADIPLEILPATLNAPELKWAISQCEVFVGARTHATIAAFSMHVPTLSIAYSIKALGINRDVFGHTDHVVTVRDLTPGYLAERMQTLLNDRNAIRDHLKRRLPEIRQQTLAAGAQLRAHCR